MSEDKHPKPYSHFDTPTEAYRKGMAAYPGVPRAAVPSSYARRPKLQTAWTHGWDEAKARAERKG